MEIEYAFLADYADRGSKLTAIGIGFDAIYAQQAPTMHPQFFSVIGLRFERSETGRKKHIEMELVDADGNQIAPKLEIDIQVAKPAKNFDYRRQRIALGMYGMVFPKYGDYAVNWILDGLQIRSVSLKLLPTSEMPAGAQPPA